MLYKDLNIFLDPILPVEKLEVFRIDNSNYQIYLNKIQEEENIKNEELKKLEEENKKNDGRFKRGRRKGRRKKD